MLVPFKSNRVVEIPVSSPHLQTYMFKDVKHKIEVRVVYCNGWVKIDQVRKRGVDQDVES